MNTASGSAPQSSRLQRFGRGLLKFGAGLMKVGKEALTVAGVLARAAYNSVKVIGKAAAVTGRAAKRHPLGALLISLGLATTPLAMETLQNSNSYQKTVHNDASGRVGRFFRNALDMTVGTLAKPAPTIRAVGEKFLSDANEQGLDLVHPWKTFSPAGMGQFQKVSSSRSQTKTKPLSLANSGVTAYVAQDLDIKVKNEKVCEFHEGDSIKVKSDLKPTDRAEVFMARERAGDICDALNKANARWTPKMKDMYVDILVKKKPPEKKASDESTATAQPANPSLATHYPSTITHYASTWKPTI